MGICRRQSLGGPEDGTSKSALQSLPRDGRFRARYHRRPGSDRSQSISRVLTSFSTLGRRSGGPGGLRGGSSPAALRDSRPQAAFLCTCHFPAPLCVEGGDRDIRASPLSPDPASRWPVRPLPPLSPGSTGGPSPIASVSPHSGQHRLGPWPS